MRGTAADVRLRIRAGLTLLASSVVVPVAALLFPAFGLPSASSSLFVGLLVAGVPEMLCLAAVALLDREGFDALHAGFRRRPAGSAAVSRLRYYGGLVYCGLNTLPIALYAYVPSAMPGGGAKYVILAATDLGFVLALLLTGGPFWEKFRRLFVWEAERS
jgi:hypothetical protein